MIKKVVSHKLTYLDYSKLANLANLSLKEVPGIVIEAGCALGGSSIVLCAAKHKDKPLRIYDVFGMIPSPTEDDDQDVHNRYEIIKNGKSPGIKGDLYYGYSDDLYNKVIRSFLEMGYPIEENNVSLIKGLVQDTLYVEEKVSLVHIDVDWYEPVKVCLERIVPKLSKGGAIVVDDYLCWSGCKKAVDEYFQDRDGYKFEVNKSLIIKKL